MRTILLIVAVVTLNGCSSTQPARRKETAAASRDIPVVSERPSVFERQKVSRQNEAERATLGLTDVSGNLTR